MIADNNGRNTIQRHKLHRVARSAVRRGDYTAAKRALKRCVNLDRTDAVAWEQYGNIHYASGNYPLAVSAFRRALRSRELSVNSRIRFAMSIALGGALQKAGELFEQLLHDAQVDSGDLLQIATGLNAVGRTHLALQACRRSLQEDPDSAQAYFELGYYCDKCGYPASTSESLMRKALKCDPRNAKFQIGLACLLARTDRPHEAWLVIRDLGATKISSMTCSCCVERLLELYRHAKDERRVVLCHQRLVELRLRGCGFDC